jgi:iron complex outermembrane recepter protein
MKALIVFTTTIFFGLLATAQKTTPDTTLLQPVEVTAIKAAEKSPFAKTTINKATIANNNLGQDLPFLLNQTPSVVANSDAGNAVGYTGIRIRGVDAQRINVTLNGIPFNDAESQGSFLVNLPDIASSASNIQIQRGVGTSTNGAGAFGGSIHINLNDINKQKYAEISSSAGSFATFKNTVKFGTGLLGNHFTVDGRLSAISSNGYIDRATSRLGAQFLSAAYLSAKTSLRLNIINGVEKTYQAWNGVPQDSLLTNRTFNLSGTERPGQPYNNETDNYKQTHLQLFFNHKINTNWQVNINAFYTKGRGYYEQYKANRKLSSFGLPNYTSVQTGLVTRTDVVRQLWLDNHFYGSTYNLQYQKNKVQLIFGGIISNYQGQHFGKLIWAQVQAAVPANYTWYNLPAQKFEVSNYAKLTYTINPKWQLFTDAQHRHVKYKINGFRENPTINLNNTFNFFNPKFGITYTNKGWQAYASYAKAAKEPNRDDFEAGATTQPLPEKLHDVEIGAMYTQPLYNFSANAFYMGYKNQLILNGKINDVGAYTRINVPNSYRLGLELHGTLNIFNLFTYSTSITVSKNQVKSFTNFIDNYDTGNQQATNFTNTTLAFAPSLIENSQLVFKPNKKLTVTINKKYVSQQFLDNTQSNTKKLDAFNVTDLIFNYNLSSLKTIKQTLFTLQLNNIFNEKYQPNGYTFSYINGGQNYTENFYYPMAGFNIMAGVTLKF